MPNMQIVILAGGLATRLRPLTTEAPKSMVRIHGKPFLQYQIELLRKNQIDDIVLCIGHLGEQIEEYFGDGHQFGVHIRYSREGERLLGTAGALKNAQALLDDQFLVMYGDSYLLLDYAKIYEHFLQSDKQALMVVYKNRDRYEPSNVVVRDNLVQAYDKRRKTPDMIYIDEGLSAFRRKVLDMIPAGQFVSLEEVFAKLIERRELLAYETHQRFYTIGTIEALEEFRQLVASGEIAS